MSQPATKQSQWQRSTTSRVLAWLFSRRGARALACALERHRLAHGSFPLSLAALAPRFLDKLPHDLITGEPLRYRLTDDGGYLLYSVGWDGRDDGGIIASPTKQQPALGSLPSDWVWRWPPYK